MPVAGLVSAGIGLVGSAISRANSNAELSRLMKENPQYKENPLAAERLGLARTLLNARMPGAAAAEKNIYANQASTIDNIERGATDSSQLLSAVGGVQTSTNEAFNNLGVQEAMDYQRRYGNYSNAQDGLINEKDKVFQDKVRRFQDKVQMKGAQQQNNGATWQELSNFGFGVANLELAGGLATRMPTDIIPHTWKR